MHTKIGLVTSAKMLKTVVVTVEEKVVHPLYRKSFRRSPKFYAHTETVIAEGSKVKIQECRPLSKLKRWKVVEVLPA